jgi:DNA-binding CsgD family transcriptional regulator
MDKFARKLGFDHFAYALSINIPSLKPQHHYINGFPPQWLEHYLARGYFKADPLVRHAEMSTLPAVWTDKSFHERDSQQFWSEAHDFGLQSGLSFSVHEQSGVTGIFSVARDKPLDVTPAELAAMVGRGQLFASILHQAVLRIDLPKLLLLPDVALTARERECLKWAADGKTAWEIGQILSIAERTAVFHINNVIRKLGAANKTQAIVRAVALKLL